MLRVFLLGLLFGITLTMEVIGWFTSTRCFGLNRSTCTGSSAVPALGAIFHLLAKQLGWNATTARPRDIYRYSAQHWKSYLLGGTVFGMGWASPAPAGTAIHHLGAGYFPILVAIVGALLSTLLHGILRDRLPLISCPEGPG